MTVNQLIWEPSLAEMYLVPSPNAKCRTVQS